MEHNIDSLNDKAYKMHYVSIDSTLVYATKAYESCQGYVDGKMEALNNLAFVEIVKMQYTQAETRLLSILEGTDNQIELLVANIQMMRLCQRQSRNKEFYDYYWHAQQNIARIQSDINSLTERQSKRYFYAQTEMQIILSAYLYYVGQINASNEALSVIDKELEIQKDTAQLLNFFYNVGTGGYINQNTPQESALTEFEYLVRCYFLADRAGQVLWQANALQAMSEHMQNLETRDFLITSNRQTIQAINIDNVADSLLVGNFAKRAYELFSSYGDVYQSAAALRTLSDSYFLSGEHELAIECLNEALNKDTLIMQSPSMISSLHEKLSINYSALNEKQNSDYHRNCYLQIHDETRQDRELEARAEQMSRTSILMNTLIVAVCVAIFVVVVFLLVITQKRKKGESTYTIDSLLEPLDAWKEMKLQEQNAQQERYDEIIEEQKTEELLHVRNLRNNIEQRARMSLVNSITPFVDRMLGEINHLINRSEDEETVQSRYAYILELAEKINEYNDVLTNWIQLRRGELSLKIESFRLQELFEIVKKGRMSFKLKDVELTVMDTDLVVKADKSLTLFMINTIADNARKAIQGEGEILVSADDKGDCVEVIVADTGIGMDDKQLSEVFNHQPSVKKQHGFGLMNCKGIIEKYRKISPLFNVCQISAESKMGIGTTFRFCLPKGVVRLVVVLMQLAWPLAANSYTIQEKVRMFADSTYFSNLQAQYDNTIRYADSARTYINTLYKDMQRNGHHEMKLLGENPEKAAELIWLADSLPMNYDAILDVRNETAVAALALHRWDLYNYNNSIYSRLYRELSADPNLPLYISKTQRGAEVKKVAIIILILILISIFPAYYILYYRQKVYYRFLIDKISSINKLLLTNTSDEHKLRGIQDIWNNEINHSAQKNETSNLNEIVMQISNALEEGMVFSQESQQQMEYATDELNRLKYENGILHVNNNVLDNCFSTIKHETMYYPSRICQVVRDSECKASSLYELTSYYKDLFILLSMQAQRQVERKLPLNAELRDYLCDLLKKLNNNKDYSISKSKIDDVYNRYIVEIPSLALSEAERENLFTPLTTNLSCLVIRQIVREIGETTNHRGCGIYAEERIGGGTNLVITLSDKINIE